MASKAEYLKRYMSEESAIKKKKKEKKPLVDKSRIKILDDDVDFKALLPENINNTLDDDIGDDTPAVAQFIDERPQHVKELERFRQSKQWKLVSHRPDSDSGNHQSSVNHSTDSTQRSAKDYHSVAVTHRNQRHDSDSDLDVPRHRSEQRHNDSDSDLSPMRAGQQHNASSGVSAVRGKNQRHDSSSDSDLSPVRASGSARQRVVADSEQSPKQASKRQYQRHDSDSDLSPARANDHSALNTARGVSHRHDSDSDLSPPRTKNFRSTDSDLSSVDRDRKSDHSSRQPAHHQRHSSHPDDPRQTKRTVCKQDSDGDLSPQRRRPIGNPAALVNRHQNDSDSDLSPTRADKTQKATVHNEDRQKTAGKATKTLSGAQAGLQLAADMRKESQELRRREIASFAKISDEVLGKNAQTVVRDKATGRKRDLDAERAAQAETDAAKAVTAAKYDAWNKGLRQKELHEERLQDAVHEAEKPLARYGDDADLDARLREQEREGDTMLAYIRKKKEKGAAKSKPIYKGPEPPPNRFGIRPGYRWDGVDRSTGFEKLYFTKLSEKKAIKDLAYKWSVENM